MSIQQAEDRYAARIVLVDARERALLFNGGDPGRPEDGRWWFTPGGGIEPGETVEQAARRELFEETGVRVAELGPVVREDYVEFPFEGRMLRQHQTFYRVRVAETTVDVSGWTELERRSVHTYAWWTAAELRTTGEVVYPEDLVDLLA